MNNSHERLNLPDSLLTKETGIIPHLEYPRGKEALPEKIDTVFWDVDGTITDRDIPDPRIIQTILQTANQGVNHNFITGRDRFWLEENLKPIFDQVAHEEGIDINSVLPNIHYFPELGLMSMDPISGEPREYEGIRDHPLINSSLRSRIASFFLQTRDLLPADGNTRPPSRHFVIKDANGIRCFCPFRPHDLNPEIKLPDFIWSDTKELIGTAEVVRDAEGRISPERQAKILLAAEIINKFLQYWNYHEDIILSPVSTAINIAPVVNGIPLDKDWAIGMILNQTRESLIRRGKTVTVEDLASRSIAIGDGYADFLFSRPRIANNQFLDVAFGFVGPKDQMHENPDKTKNLVVRSEGYHGPQATNDILEQIQDRFIPALD
ncbi:hypothetical protein KKB64_05685 [Patescibacteria group bacterium]|nr:hypothetical protein [Patescibacteria group bacterium]MBU1473239.1 hypothetical protein [Patescibacteria group bacterium]MBU2459495.1 hypothetical protein [Patescibacteria group bacterium]MBU2544154.1 hypothetical protein [Patescibacteria group bacterium]